MKSESVPAGSPSWNHLFKAMKTPMTLVAHGTASRKGSALLASLILVMLVSTTLTSFLALCSNTAQQAEASFIQTSLYNVAETGADKALGSLSSKDWADWTQEGDNYIYRSRGNVSLGNGRLGSMNVLVMNASSMNPTIIAEGRIESMVMKGMIEARQLKIGVILKPRGKHDWGYSVGMVSRNGLTFSGNNGFLASFDSRIDPNPTPVQGHHGYDITVATIRDESNLTFLEAGGATVYGILASGGSQIDYNKSGLTVRGANSPAGVTVDPNQIFYDFYAELPDVPAAPTDYIKTTVAGMNTNLPSKTAKITYYLTDSIGKQNPVFTQGDFTIIAAAGVDVTGLNYTKSTFI